MKFKPKKRYLVYDKESTDYAIGQPDAIEVKCLEISPKGRVKLRYLSGGIGWEFANRFEIVEELP